MDKTLQHLTDKLHDLSTLKIDYFIFLHSLQDLIPVKRFFFTSHVFDNIFELIEKRLINLKIGSVFLMNCTFRRSIHGQYTVNT